MLFRLRTWQMSSLSGTSVKSQSSQTSDRSRRRLVETKA